VHVLRTGRVTRGRAVVLAAGALWAGLMVVALWPPQRIDGAGTLYGHLWCVGIKFDSGDQYPVSVWPPGLYARGYDGVVVDQAGNVVLKTGERVTVRAHLTHRDGDTPCDYTQILTVETFERQTQP
jgi:hypothetical protein